MTTIAYRNGVKASDSGCYGEQQISFSIQKVFRLANGALYGSAGGLDDSEVRALLGQHDMSRELLKATGRVVTAILVMPDRRIYLVDVDADGVEIVEALAEYVAVGNGADCALGAMAVGATAEEAIGAAADHNIWTRLPVQKIEF